MPRYFLTLTLLALIPVAGGPAVSAPLATFRLADRVGRFFSEELVHYDLEFKPGTCWRQGMRLYDDTGQSVPLQLTDIAEHPDGSLAKATIWFIVRELPANGTVEYSLTGGAKTDAPATYQTDLSLAREEGSAVLSTSRVAVRTLLGAQTFAQPQPAEKVPAPLQGLRLRSGAWTGRGWLETKHLCTGYEATVTDDGPIFKRVQVRYTFAKPAGWAREGELFYQMTVRVVAGQEMAYLTEDYNLGDPQVYQYPQFKSEKQEMLWDWWSWRPHETGDNFCFSFFGAFRPTHARVIAHNTTTPEKGQGTGYHAESEYLLLYDKERFEFALNPWGRGEPDQSMIYTMYRREQPDSDIVAILPCFASHWRHPDVLPHEPNFIQQHTDTSDLRIYSSAQPDLYLKAPLHLGRREWALVTLRNPRVITEATNGTEIARLSRKYGALPLDKVKDWVLEWPQRTQYPHLFVKPGDLEGLRARIKSLPALEQALRQQMHIPVHRWLLEGKDEDAQKAYDELMAQMDQKIDDALTWPYGGERTGINAFPWHMMTYASHADVLLASSALREDQKKAMLARLAFLTYLIWDPEYMPPRKAGFGWGSAGMPTNAGGGRGALSALLSDHPMAPTWIATVAKYLNYVIQQYFGEDGTPFSCPHYSLGTEGGPVSTVMLAMKSTGAFGDLKTNYPNLYNYCRWLVDMMPPKDIRFGQLILPTLGDTYWEGNGLAGHIAGLVKDSDPELARNLMWVWYNSGQSLEGFINAAFFFDPTIPPERPALKSVAYPGLGAFLRSGVGSEEESYIAVRFGNFTIGHMHNEAGSVHWYARGVPLSLDWGSMYTPQASAPWWHSTLSYNHQEHAQPVPCPGRGHPDCFYTGKSWFEHQFEPNAALAPIADMAAGSITELNGKIAAFATQPGADYVRGEANRHWFQKMPYYLDSPQPWAFFTEFDRIELKKPFPWVRQFAFVKDASPSGPNYLVIADDLTGNQELEPAFNFWCLAHEVKQVAPRQYYFTGQHGIDLDMFILDPKEGRIQLGGWSHKQGFLGGGEESQKLVRVYGKPDGSGFRVVLYPRKGDEPQPQVTALADGRLVRVVLPDQTHWILLSKEPVTVSDGPVTLSGTTAVVKQWRDGRVELVLLAGGKVMCGERVLERAEPASLMQ